jgi:hypothetical protein
MPQVVAIHCQHVEGTELHLFVVLAREKCVEIVRRL